MIEKGYTLWARQSIESKIFFYKPAMWFKIWFYIVNKVNHKDTKLFKRGEALITYEDIMAGTKASKQQTKDCVHFLEMDHMIESTRTTRGMIRKVLNYGFYQDTKNYKTTERTQDRPLADHLETPPINNNVIMKEVSTIQIELINFWNSKLTKKFKPSLDLENNLSYWLKTYSVEDLKAAISNIPVLAKDQSFWKSMRPKLFFRQRNSQGEADYIEQAFNVEKPKGNTSDQLINLLNQ